MNIVLAPEIQILLILVGVFYFSVCFFNTTVGLTLMAVAMLFSPEIALGSVGVRQIAVRLEDLLIPMLFLAWLARAALRRDSRLFTPSPLNLPMLLILLLSVISTLRGFSRDSLALLPAMFYIFKTAEFFAIYFLVLNYVKTERQIRFFLFLAVLTAALIGCYTLTQVHSVEIFTERRITAPFEGRAEPASVGGYMAFLLLIIVSLFLYEKRPLGKWLYGLIGTSILIPFVYTLNRTSYVAFLGGLFLIAVIEKRRKFIFFIFFALLISPLWLPNAVKERIAFTWKDAQNPGRVLGVDYSFQERITLYTRLWNSWKYVPFIGAGVTAWETSDSQYARTLYEIGTIGLGFWLWLFLRLHRMSCWLFDQLEEGTLKGMVLGFRAGLIGLLLHGFGAITFYIVRIMEPFMFVSGLVVSLYLLKSAELKVTEESTAGSR